MADVTAGRGDTERGQLIIITGLLVAVTFVVLTLLVNTAIFTDNLASRGTDVGGRDAVEFQRTSVDGLEELLDRENQREHASQPAVETNVTTGVAAYNDVRTQFGIDSGVVSVLNESALILHPGRLLRQTESSRNLSSASGATDWTLAMSAEDTRQFAVTVTGGLNETSDPKNDSFRITVDGGADEWVLYVYEQGGNPELAVQNASQSTPTMGVCSVSGTPFTIDLTAGTVDGTSCAALEFAKGVGSPYDIEYGLGDQASGTYNLTVNTTTVGDFNGPGSTASPYEVPAVYSMTVPLHYEVAAVEYRTTVRVAGGEPT